MIAIDYEGSLGRREHDLFCSACLPLADADPVYEGCVRRKATLEDGDETEREDGILHCDNCGSEEVLP